MLRIRLFFFLFCIVAVSATAAGLRDLVALPDGQTAYFRMRTGVATDSGFRLSGQSIHKVQPNPADVNETGDILATAFIGTKSCGFAGSSCFLQPACAANASIVSVAAGDSWTTSASVSRETLIRLDRTGKLAWIEQGKQCFSVASPPLATGLYDTRTLQPASPAASGYTLANPGIGRRVITSRSGVLVKDAYDRLAWWARDGTVRQIGNRVAPREAVTDAEGCTVVYSADQVNVVIWVDWCADPNHWEEVLGVTGTSLALSDNGRYLAYFENGSGRFAVYDRIRRVISRDLLPEAIESFAIGGTALFAATSRNGLIRLDLDSGEVRTTLPPLPQIDEVHAAKPLSVACPLVCYGPVEPRMMLSEGMLVFLDGHNLDQPGWRVRTGPDMDMPLPALAESTAWFPYVSTEATIFHPDYPGLELRLLFARDDNAFACLSMDHQEGYRWVTAEDPALVGETIHVWMTGLAVRMPPELADPGAAEVAGFGRSEDWKGLQNLDLRIRRPFISDNGRMFAYDYAYGCVVPPVRSVP
jgi:hypothetical protein